MAKEYPFLEKVCKRIEKDIENDRVPFFPLVDPNKIRFEFDEVKSYLGSREFLGDNVWLWKEMRKK